jgi:hypothetical protein
MLNVLNATYQNRNAATRLWNVAPTCSLFLKKSTKKTGDRSRQAPKSKKRTTLRANRALKGHTLKSLASGAASSAAVLVQTEALQLRCDVNPESSKYPLLPCVSRGAAALIEAAFIAYMQEAFGNSVELKKAMRKHKKVTPKCAQAGVDALNERIAAATSFVPASVTPKLPTLAAPKKKAAKPAEAEAEA